MGKLKKIRECLLRLNVANSWISSEGIASGSDLKMYRWDGSVWAELVTTLISKDDTNSYYEAKTDGFSYFAITGLKSATVLDEGTKGAPTEQDGDQSAIAISPKSELLSISLVYIILLLGIIAVPAYLYSATRTNY